MVKPIAIMWESTIACGLSCKHCKASAKKTRDPDELTTNESYDLVDQIVEFGSPYPFLRITGGNALMRDDIFDIIEYAKNKGVHVTIAPSTTPLLNRTNIERLKKAGVDVVALSIDGPSAEIHDEFRGVKGTFDTLIKAIKIMRELNLPFRLLTTVTKFNVRHLPEIFILSKKLNAIGWYVYMLIPTGRAKAEYELSPQETEDVFNFIYDVMKLKLLPVNAIAGGEPFRRVAVMRKLVEDGLLKLSELRLGGLYYFLTEKLKKLLKRENFDSLGSPESSERKRSAKIFGKGLFVAKNGDIYPSSFLPIKIGNVREDTLLNIYRRSKLLRELNDPRKIKGKCRVCEFNDICRGSRSRAYALKGDYLAEDPACVYEPGAIRKMVNNWEVLEEIGITNYSRKI